MTGPEHYLKAEQLLGMLFGLERGASPAGESFVAEAQVHATLAAAAATALGTSPAEGRAWADVAGTRPSDSQ